MKRRAFLTTSGATLLAGCSGSPTEPAEDIDRQTTQTTDIQTQTKTTQADVDTAKVVIDDAKWKSEGESVEFLIGNNGEGMSGHVTVVARWYDSAGRYIGHDQASIPALHSGASWKIEVNTTSPFSVNNFDAYVEYEDRYISDELNAWSVEIDESIPAITGIVDHGRDDETAVDVLATTYDSGWITHVGTTVDTRIPDREWRFMIPLVKISDISKQVGENVELMFHTA
ncbi:FxLYD domain-containing protein [Haloferax namakaokahaiae]|uniref:FxLYD domain-containing protein n=1 Tax=Haloferax namakaokahaiae TaxID=1748331 RepID=A0ABD5ZFU0_9EURY